MKLAVFSPALADKTLEEALQFLTSLKWDVVVFQVLLI